VFNFLIINPLTNLLLGFYELLGGNLGFAIILFTIFIRVILLPITIRQIRLQKKMAELQPRLQELQSKRKDPAQVTQEEMALMKQTAGSCIGGIVPFLIQIPIFLGLYNVINEIASAKSGDIFNDNVYFEFLKHDASFHFNTQFLGFDLAGIPSKLVGFNIGFLPFAILLALLVITQVMQSRLMSAMQKSKQAQQKAAVTSKKKKANDRKPTKKEQEKVEMQEEMQKMMNLQMTYLLPLVIGVAAYSFPAALSIYWLTQNIFGIIQMEIQNRFSDGRLSFGKDKGLPKEKKEKARIAEFEDAKPT
jgi:YidC/Oxa1 family membrane protein insertase